QLLFVLNDTRVHRDLYSFPTRRSSDLGTIVGIQIALRWFQNFVGWNGLGVPRNIVREAAGGQAADAVIANSPKVRSEIRRFYRIDRKSTRLNSSHGSISYAVFCLKKKT